MDRKQRKNRPKKKEKSDRQWNSEFRTIQETYQFGGKDKESNR
jgi:hypothetical protein